MREVWVRVIKNAEVNPKSHAFLCSVMLISLYFESSLVCINRISNFYLQKLM